MMHLHLHGCGVKIRNKMMYHQSHVLWTLSFDYAATQRDTH